MVKLEPYADDAASVDIGELTVENGTDKVALYGSLDLTRDKAGLERARKLKTLLDPSLSGSCPCLYEDSCGCAV